MESLTSLRGKILLYASSLLVVLVIAMLAYINFEARRFVSQTIENEIERGRESLSAAETDRVQDLKLTASLVASFPEMRALLTETDSATIGDFLLQYEQASGRSELLIVLDPQGRVIARTDRSEGSPSEEFLRDRDGVFIENGAAYHFATAPAEAAGIVYGFIVAAAAINDDFARSLGAIANGDIVIVAEKVVGSTLPEADVPFKDQPEWSSAIPPDGGQKVIDVQGEEYSTLSTLMGSPAGFRPMAIIMRSRDRALAPYRQIQVGLVVLGLVATIAGVAGSAFFARSVTAPVAQLVKGTQEVASGNFDYRIDVRTRDEIGNLAQSFNHMIQGLRERANMQKFVSQSTVEMIQTSSQKKTSAGEKVTLTILFSDMRGFTTLAERSRPEDTVRLLNECLSLQADKVKKFHGDIDKYVGDCVVALFTNDDMELNAIRCALEIHKALESRNAERPTEEPLQVGIGIATGEVILGSIGSEDRLDFTVIGSHVNLCARLCSLARPGETLISEATYLKVEGLVAAERLQPVNVKGFTAPVPIYRSLRRAAIV